MGNKNEINKEEQESVGQKNLKDYETRLRKKHPTGKAFEIDTIDGSIQENIKEYYEFLEIISSSKYSTVRKAKKKDGSKKLFAIKSFPMYNSDESYISKLIAEVGILIKICHPNVVDFIETYYDKQYFHIVMQYVDCMPIQDFLAKYKIRPEKVQKVASQLFKVVSYLQTQKLDLFKLTANNVCLNKNLDLTVTGFGSVLTEDNEINSYRMHYLSPEELKGKKTNKTIVWTVGVILYYLAYEKLPFSGKTDKEVYTQILENNPKAHESDVNWKLISLCLAKDPEDRLSLEDAQSMLKSTKRLSDNSTVMALERIKNYSKEPVFKKIVFEHILRNVPQDDLLQLTKVFNTIDLDNKGTISKDELKVAFKINKIQISEERLNKLIEVFDNDGDNEIDYKEFLLAGLKDYVEINDALLMEVFDAFDCDGKGVISCEDLSKMLLKGGKQVVDEGSLKKILEEISDTAEISKEQFIKLFK